MSDCNTSAVYEDAVECLEKPSNDLLVWSSISQVEILINGLKAQCHSSVLDEQERHAQLQRFVELEKVVAKLKNEIVGVFDELRAANQRLSSLEQHLDGVQPLQDSFLGMKTGVGMRSPAMLVYHSTNEIQRISDEVEFSRADLIGGAMRSPYKRHRSDEQSETVCQHNDEEVDADASSYHEFSLMAVANRSLDMSRSLTERCSKLADLQIVDKLSAAVIPDQHLPSIVRQDHSVTTHEVLQKTPGHRESVVSEPPSDSCESSSPMYSMINTEGLRLRVSHEILNTEKKYCSCLLLLLDHFSASLLTAGVLSTDDAQIMFPSCLSLIHKYHHSFFHQLEERLAKDHLSKLFGDVLDEFVTTLDSDLLAYYKLYVSLFPGALVKLRKMSRQNEDFHKILKSLESHPNCEGLDVTSFLLTPVQRIPRYVLLFKQLLRHTRSDHEDYVPLERCISRLGDCLSDLNESIESSMTAVSATNQCTSPSAKPKRRFQLSAFSFRSTLNTPSNQRNSASKLDYNDGNPAPIVGHLRRNLPALTSTPITYRHELGRPSSITSVDSTPCQSTHSDLELGGITTEAEPDKENNIKRPPCFSGSNLAKPVRSRLLSFPSTGSLFNISKVEWDRSRLPPPLFSSNDSSDCGPMPAAPHRGFQLPFSRVRSIPDVAQIRRPPIPTLRALLPDSSKSNGKRKLSDSSDTSLGSSIMQRLTRHKSDKLSMGDDESIILQSQLNATKVNVRRKPAFRDSIRRIFARRGFNVTQNADVSSSSTGPGSQPVLRSVSQLSK